jgi:hypothetical protein
MHQLIKLPSGLFVNLSLVTRIVPLEDNMLEVHFTGGDPAVLKGEDAEVFRRRSGLGGASSNTLKQAVFWVVLMAAVLMVYLAVRSRS